MALSLRSHFASRGSVLAAAAILATSVAACSGGPTGTDSGLQAESAQAAVPVAVEGFEVQKVPAEEIPPLPEIGGRTALEASFAIALGQSQDVYRVVAFRTEQDPASVTEADRLAVVGEEGAAVDPATGRDIVIGGADVRCYDAQEFGDVSLPDTVCVYVDGVNLVFVVTHDQGPGGGEEFTRRVLAARETQR